MTPHAVARRTQRAFDITALTSTAWDLAHPVAIDHDWSGRLAPAHRATRVDLLWNQSALFARFTCAQGEPLVTRAQPDLGAKVMGLWDHDVVEIFIAPDLADPHHYFEFEVAPTGEWLDVELRWFPDRRDSNWAYASAMRTAARVNEDSVIMAMELPWAAFGRTAPSAGERWSCNLFRCVGAGPTRGYLAWRPTHTATPAFHVPQAFAPLHFEA
jgi:hypothetical protein